MGDNPSLLLSLTWLAFNSSFGWKSCANTSSSLLQLFAMLACSLDWIFGIAHTDNMIFYHCCLCVCVCVEPSAFISPQWGAADAEIKSHLVRTQSLNVLPLKPGVGQYIAIHATLTARDFFLFCLFRHFRSSHLHFFQNLSRFFPVLAVANTCFPCRPADQNRSSCRMQVPVLSARGI